MHHHLTRRLRGAAALGATVALTLSAFVAHAGPASAAGSPPPPYYPSGPQTGVPVASVTGGGWTQCYLDSYADDLEGALPDVLSACSGKYLMLAARATGSDTLSLLAAAPREDVLHDTGADDQETTHRANGSEWYFDPHWSWGFAEEGSQVAKYQCDTLAGASRLCWHTYVGAGGYRVGDAQWLNSSRDYERVVYQSGVRGIAQSMTFSTTAPTRPYVGQTYDVAAVSDSGLPVSLASSNPQICELDGSRLTFRAAGDCTVTADQAGDQTYEPAQQASQVMTVEQVPTQVAVTAPTDAVSGQPVKLAATVSTPADAPGGTPAGSVQFSVDNAAVGGPVALGPDAKATSAVLDRKTGAHDIGAVFTPSDVATYTTSTGSGTLGVGPSRTTTRVSVSPDQLKAVVSPVAPGAGVPTGTVTFRVAGAQVGTVALTQGAATLQHRIQPGQSRQVSTEYSGDQEMTGSTDSLSRNDPTITARITSARPRTSAGWYSAPVRIIYTCTARGAELSTPCPGSDSTSANNAQQTFTRSVSAADGGVSSLVTRVDLDQVRPTVALRGVRAGARYFARGPKARCSGADALSGIRSCTITRKRGHHGLETVTATATDMAGNVATTRTSYLVVRQAIGGATYSHGTYIVHRGGSYPVLSVNRSRPVYRVASLTPEKLGQAWRRSQTVRTNTGRDTWAYGPVWNMPRTRSGIWYVGVQEGRTIVPIKVRLIG